MSVCPKLNNMKFPFNIFDRDKHVKSHMEEYDQLKHFRRVCKRKDVSLRKVEGTYRKLQKCSTTLCPQLDSTIDSYKDRDGCLSDADRKTLTKEVCKELNCTADQIVSESLKYSFPLAVTQVVKMCFAFQEIHSAQLLAQEAKRVIEDIRGNLHSLEDACVAVNELIASYVSHYERSERAGQRDPVERRAKLAQIKTGYCNIRSKYARTKSMLTGLKSRVDAQIIRLKSYQESQLNDMVDNFSHGLVMGYQACKMRKEANVNKSSQMFGVAAGFTTLGCLNIYAAQRTGKLVDTLKGYQDDINAIEKELIHFEEIMKGIAKFIEEERKKFLQ